MCLRKQFSVEGYLNNLGSDKPSTNHDDTELRALIQKNADAIEELDENKASKDVNAVEDNFAAFDEVGNIKDSGCNESDFAPAVHSHTEIGAAIKRGTAWKRRAFVNTYTADEEHESKPTIVLSLGINESGTPMSSKSAAITLDNMDNLSRALENPAEPASNGNKLITNGQVYAALLKQCGTISVTKSVAGTSFDIDSDFDDDDRLESFISNHVQGIEYPVEVVVNDASTSEEYLFIGLASWHNNTSQQKVRVRLKLNTMLLTAVCTYSESYGTSNTWASSWTVVDQSSILQLSE